MNGTNDTSIYIHTLQSSTQQASLPATTSTTMAAPQYTLYELVAREDDKESQSGHSPFVNKTKADLA